MKRKIYIALLAMCILVTMCFTAAPAFAKQADIAGYSSAKALEYAKANTMSDSQDGGDCVVFVRACVEAGGVPKEEGRKYGYSVKDYADYLIKNDWVEVFEVNTSYYYSTYEGSLHHLIRDISRPVTFFFITATTKTVLSLIFTFLLQALTRVTTKANITATGHIISTTL